eukprot:scaffold67757_cov63-Phaeocystis_antarctica.AAC.1
MRRGHIPLGERAIVRAQHQPARHAFGQGGPPAKRAHDAREAGDARRPPRARLGAGRAERPDGDGEVVRRGEEQGAALVTCEGADRRGVGVVQHVP